VRDVLAKLTDTDLSCGISVALWLKGRSVSAKPRHMRCAGDFVVELGWAIPFIPIEMQLDNFSTR